MAQSNDQLIPIDIHYNKLLDWLVDRRHCELRWAAEAKDIRGKLQEELKDLPSSPVTNKLKSASTVHYFHVTEVIEELKASEGDGAKNIFGQYSSKRMKNWLEIQRLYEKKNVYLAECAQILARNVNYEIPALKRQLSRATQQQQDCDRKEAEHLTTAKACKEMYKTKCQELGVAGDNPKAELLRLAHNLPQSLDEIAAQARQDLPGVMEFYIKFTSYVRGSEPSTAQLSLLRRLVEEGNITLHQWETGEKPQMEVVTSLPVIPAAQDSTTERIDWGDEDLTSEGKGYEDDIMDFGGDFDITIEDTGSGITVENDGEDSQTQLEDTGIEVESRTSPPSSLTTVLESIDIRNRFLDDLSELQAFLAQRILEKKEDSHEPVIMIHSLDSLDLPDLVKEETREKLLSFKEKVDSIVNSLTSHKMTKLFLIRTSPTYIDRVVESLQFHLRQSSKAESMVTLCAQRRQEAFNLQGRSRPILEQVTRETKELQSMVGKEISKRYSNRIVNIMGEINLI